MADPRKPSTFARHHGALWYRSFGYRLSWLALPQALGALVLAVFFMGGGLGDLSFKGGSPADDQTAGDWAKPMDMRSTEDELNKLRDAASEGDAAALAELEAVAKGGDAIASFKLGVLYSPYFAASFPYPTQKDAARAAELFEPSAKAGFWKAYGALGEIYVGEPKPLLNMAKGCDYLIRYIKDPERQTLGWQGDEISRMINGANCLANELYEEGANPGAPSKEAAEQALKLFEDPLLANEPLALASKVKLLTRDDSPIKDAKASCPTAEAWYKVTTPETRPANQRYILTAHALCLTNGFDFAPAVPPKAAQEAALEVLSLPELEQDSTALANRAWLLFQPWDIADPERACQATFDWVAVVGDDKETIESTMKPWTQIKAVDCLMGVHAGQAPHKPTPQDMEMVFALARSAASRGDPSGDYAIGQVYHFGGGGVNVDREEAVKYYETCSAAGKADCDWRLGGIYAYGELGYDKDLPKAVSYYKRCASAGLTFCDAQLGYLYRVDSSIDLTAQEVVAHLRKAAEAGVSLGAENLAYAYYKGEYGLKVNMEEAAVWLIRSMTMPGGAVVRDWLAGKPDALGDPDFWKAAHSELTRLGVYSGKISSKANSETVAALYQLK